MTIKLTELEKDLQQQDYQLNYGVNQKKRAIERIKQLLSEIKEIPTETYEYAYYSFNVALENLENQVGKLEGYAEDKGHNDESG
jgi:DNA repair exonuclease SbcCD ATPase subunit